MRRYQLRSQFHQILSEKQDTISAQPAIIGDESGNVMVDGEGNQVWVQIAGLPATTAFNTRVAARWGEPVWVGYDPVQPGILQVLGVRFGGRYGEDSEVTPATVLAHHSNHEWLGGASGSGGEDVVYSDLRQLMPLRVSATGSMGIGIHGNTNLEQDRGWQDFSFSELDLTAYVPTGSAGSSGSAAACLALISLDSAGSPAVTVGATKTLATLSIGDLPALPDYHRPLAAVRLYAGQTEIVEARQRQDIADLRWNFYDPGHSILKHLAPGGSSGQVVGLSGSSLAWLSMGSAGVTPLSDAAPQTTGMAAAGTSGSASRSDHVHALETVDLTKLQSINAYRLLGNAGSASGTPGQIDLGNGLDFAAGALRVTPTSGSIGYSTSSGNADTVDGVHAAGFVQTSASAGGDLTGTFANLQIGLGAIVNEDVSGSAAIAITKLQSLSAARLLGNSGSAAAVPEQISLGNGLEFSGATLQIPSASGSIGYAASAGYSASAGNADTVDAAHYVGLTTYTVTWTSSGGNPSIGNGSLVGAYSSIGNFVTLWIMLTIGSTTNLGTGDWSFSLPFTAAASPAINYLGMGYVRDYTVANYPRMCQISPSGTVVTTIMDLDDGTNVNRLTPTVPISWGTNDTFQLAISYMKA